MFRASSSQLFELLLGQRLFTELRYQIPRVKANLARFERLTHIAICQWCMTVFSTCQRDEFKDSDNLHPRFAFGHIAHPLARVVHRVDAAQYVSLVLVNQVSFVLLVQARFSNQPKRIFGAVVLEEISPSERTLQQARFRLMRMNHAFRKGRKFCVGVQGYRVLAVVQHLPLAVPNAGAVLFLRRKHEPVSVDDDFRPPLNFFDHFKVSLVIGHPQHPEHALATVFRKSHTRIRKQHRFGFNLDLLRLDDLSGWLFPLLGLVRALRRFRLNAHHLEQRLRIWTGLANFLAGFFDGHVRPRIANVQQNLLANSLEGGETFQLGVARRTNQRPKVLVIAQAYAHALGDDFA
uniref:(northern house mosquito) hypothetical protein n=1 Tax=Culex pipiens TaxID=7175 RepID=A0A8D8BGI4_CULPI